MILFTSLPYEANPTSFSYYIEKKSLLFQMSTRWSMLYSFAIFQKNWYYYCYYYLLNVHSGICTSQMFIWHNATKVFPFKDNKYKPSEVR